ncbi:MAG: 2-oxoacid ferredoxin oxidoreductase [Candidatus Lokiarchaeota archaeon]|nr:2-oxoacid ferredoxin oxidoreductase [Candidatus Lokiarchaeota archaeon]
MKISSKDFDLDEVEISWCPGCGNYNALKVMKEALTDLGIKPHEFVLVSGIGQAGKFPHFIKAQSFNGLHGRYLSAALGIKASNPELTVIAVSGDGCTLSEGGNHFLHTIRYNPDIINVIHNNQVYGLTKGQASPTSQLGFKTKVQVFGVINEPFNALAVAISLNASFVARAFVGDLDKTKEILKQTINHKGYALIDLLCPCVTFNRVNTYQWYKEKSFYLDEAHDPFDQMKAMKLALDTDKLALGILYKNPKRKPYHENVQIYNDDKRALYQRDLDKAKFNQLLESFK